MEFENGFEVQASIDDVWEAMLDVERMAPCVPGAKVLSRSGDDAYDVAIKIKLGPITQQYQGTIEVVDRDPAQHTATMRARARETRGQGSAEAQVRMVLESADGTTRGTIHTDMALSGKAAAMGSGMVKDVAGRITQQFAANLAQMLRAGTEPGAVVPATAAQPGREAATTEAASEPALPIASILAGVVAKRLQSPAGLGVAVLLALLVGLVLGRATS